MQSATKGLRARKPVDYTQKANNNHTPQWIKASSTSAMYNDVSVHEKGDTSELNKENRKPYKRVSSSEQPGVEDDGDLNNAKRKAMQSTRVSPSKRSKRNTGVDNKASKSNKTVRKATPASKNREAVATKEADARPQQVHPARSQHQQQVPAHGNANHAGTAIHRPHVQGTSELLPVEQVLRQLPDGADATVKFNLLQDAYQDVLSQYHTLKSSTILNAEAVLQQHKQHHEQILRSKEAALNHWREEAKRNAELARVNCIDDYKAENARLEAQTLKLQAELHKATAYTELQAKDIQTLKAQLEMQTQKSGASESKLRMELQASKETMQKLRQQIKPRPRTCSTSVQTRPATKDCGVQASLEAAKPQSASVGVMTDIQHASTAAASVAVQWPTPAARSPGIGMQFPTPVAPSPGIGLQFPTPRSSPDNDVPGLSMEEWRSRWNEVNTSSNSTEHAEDDDDSPVRGLTGASPGKQNADLQSLATGLCPEASLPDAEGDSFDFQQAVAQASAANISSFVEPKQPASVMPTTLPLGLLPAGAAWLAKHQQAHATEHMEFMQTLADNYAEPCGEQPTPRIPGQAPRQAAASHTEPQPAASHASPACEQHITAVAGKCAPQSFTFPTQLVPAAQAAADNGYLTPVQTLRGINMQDSSNSSRMAVDSTAVQHLAGLQMFLIPDGVQCYDPMTEYRFQITNKPHPTEAPCPSDGDRWESYEHPQAYEVLDVGRIGAFIPEMYTDYFVFPADTYNKVLDAVFRMLHNARSKLS